MGRGRKGSGVDARTNCIRIRFALNGQRVSATLDLAPTVANLKHANRHADAVRRAVAEGTFSWARFFPEDERAQSAQEAGATFGTMADTWLGTRGAMAHTTRGKDAEYAAFWKTLIGISTVMDELLPSKLEAIVGGYAWPSDKHRNNLLAALRGICDLWVRDRPRERVSPAAWIKNGKAQLPPPDPFPLDEIELILNDMREHYDERVWTYYEFAFFAGPRPEEQIVLRWPKVDWRGDQVKIDTARTRGQEKKIKTSEVRFTDLNSRSRAALERMRKWTEMKDPMGCIFENPKTGKPWVSEADQRDLYMTPTLRRLKLRHRAAYQTRSSRATMMLMSGMNPARAARQLGHSVDVFFKRYAKWIEEAAGVRDREREKDEAGISDMGPNSAPARRASNVSD